MLRKEQQGNAEAVEFIKKLSTAASQHINFSLSKTKRIRNNGSFYAYDIKWFYRHYVL